MRLLALAAALALAACQSDGGSACNKLCDLEARCSDKVNAGSDRPRFDSGECAAACKALERDGEGKKLVSKHRACVEAAGDDCAAVLACP